MNELRKLQLKCIETGRFDISSLCLVQKLTIMKAKRAPQLDMSEEAVHDGCLIKCGLSRGVSHHHK